MNRLKIYLILGACVVVGSLVASSVEAQVIVRPPLVGPRVVARAATAPVTAARVATRAAVGTAVTGARVAGVGVAGIRPRVVTAYHPGPVYRSTLYSGPSVTTYRTVRPAVVAPVYRPVVRARVIPGRPVWRPLRIAVPY